MTKAPVRRQEHRGLRRYSDRLGVKGKKPATGRNAVSDHHVRNPPYPSLVLPNPSQLDPEQNLNGPLVPSVTMDLNERLHHRVQRRRVELGLQDEVLPYVGPRKPKPIVPQGPGWVKGSLLFLLCILLAPILFVISVLIGAPFLLGR